MKNSSKMAENRVCEIFNSVLINKLNKHVTEQRKAIRFEKTTIKAVSQKLIHLDTN